MDEAAAEGTRKGEPSPWTYAASRSGPTRASSTRQLPTDHDHAARPANIRVINRRERFLGCCLVHPNETVVQRAQPCP